MATTRPGRHGGTLKVGEIGDTSNGGRPKGSKNINTIFREILAGQMTVKEGGVERQVTKMEAGAARLVEDMLKAESPDVRRRAFESVMNRMYGLPKQPIEQSGGLDLNVGINPDALDTAEKRKLAELFEKASQPNGDE